ncbi:gephyrin-like molybdotransferase Glp [Demetria terragena]|uniref:molybdopterin molybdotransferase MoeA n=1 Tax=Demetria terragena TaxID=63959 RepID=UPI000475899A|nr:gephyrin-like molybdotransferase Glp [Demetria terragena]
MIPLEQHRQTILDAVRALPSRPCASADALGLVLAEPVCSAVDLPVFTNSSMDGYAVHSADVATTPTSLPVRGDIRAGDTTTYEVLPGETRRIMTGAPMPAGADAVVQVEHTDGGTETVEIERSAVAGVHVRVQGEDLRAGDQVVEAGIRVQPHQLAAIVGAGVATVAVVPRPRVAVITTGDELVPTGEPLQHGQIHESNGPMLAALATADDATVVAVEHLRDDADLAATVERLAQEADLVMTSGGVSAGAYEPVKNAYADGGAVSFVKVAMQPGKPQGFGLVGDGVPLLALPGNPVSSLVSYLSFVRPALRVLAGRSPQQPRLTARVVDGWKSAPGRMQLARVRLGRDDDGLTMTASGASGSHVLGGLATAHAIAYVPIDVLEVRPGDVLDLELLPGESIP